MTQQRVSDEVLDRITNGYDVPGEVVYDFVLDLRDCREECARLKADRRALAEACVRVGIDEFDAGEWTEETAQAIAARILAEFDAST